MVSSYRSWAFSSVSLAFCSDRFRSLRSKEAMTSPFFTASPCLKFTWATRTEPGTKYCLVSLGVMVPATDRVESMSWMVAWSYWTTGAAPAAW